MTLTLGPRTLAVIAFIFAIATGSVLLGAGGGSGSEQPGQFRVRGNVEHGVLTLAGQDATFVTSDAKARRWQEIVKGSGNPVVEEYNRMSIVDILVNGGWEVIDYEFALDPANGDVERYLLKRSRP